MPDMSKIAQGKVSKIAKVWMFSHECAGIAQAGGLGEAVGGLAKTLGSDYGLKVTVFLPSHGRHLDPRIREAYNLAEEATFIAKGNRTGVNGIRYDFLSGVERGTRDRVDYVLVKGLDSPTSRWLDSRVLYDQDVTFEKMALFSRTVKLYSEYLLSMNRRAELPDIIHAHDWHMVPAGVVAKQHIQKRGVSVPLLYTVHLLSRITLPWHYASEDWCGIENLPDKVRTSTNKTSLVSYRQVWEGLGHNSLETFGCYAADYVTSVSESYLANDVSDYVGADAIRGKSGHIYNGCDWDPLTIKSSVLADSKVLSRVSEKAPNRWDIRKFLLTRGIAEIDSDPTSEQVHEPPRESNTSTKNEPFIKDGPLVLMTGRLSSQKGVDLLLESVPLVIETVPAAKFLLFLLEGSKDEKNAIERNASKYPDNVRIIFGKHPETYLTSHVAADVYAMPSRSEPFGISALEAMVTGNPVVGSDTGGITETVLDIKSHGKSGTGLLFPVEDTNGLADSLTSLLLMMWIGEQKEKGQGEVVKLAEKIPSKKVASLVGRDPYLGSKIRENCVSRVENHFRWKNAGKMAIDRYTITKLLGDSRGNRFKRSV